MSIPRYYLYLSVSYSAWAFLRARYKCSFLRLVSCQMHRVSMSTIQVLGTVERKNHAAVDFEGSTLEVGVG